MKTKMPLFEQAKVLVVGDVMLDCYWHGDVARVSPEAPVPVVHVRQMEKRLGGAGNVALNISALGGQVSLLSCVGDDENATCLEEMLANTTIESYLLRMPGNTTINKLRVVGRNQQLIRLDFEENHEWQNEDYFFAAYARCLADCDLVILSDYGKGVLNQSAKLIALANKMQKPVLVDPKSKDFSVYDGATVVTPNLSEFEAVVGPCRDDEEIAFKGAQLVCEHGFKAVLVTRGSYGMSLINEDDFIHLPTKAREVYDVTGAGDTVIATLGAALAAGEDLVHATNLANTAASIVVKKFGVVAISSAELRRAIQLQQDPIAILDEEHLLQQVIAAKAHGEKIVMTNGCFDILHPGHVIYLEQAKELGHRLIVAVNDDSSVRRLKGIERPINTVRDRMLLLAALSVVDWVIPFAEDTPERIIKLVSPDVLVKGGDWKVAEIVGADHVLSNGGHVTTIPYVDGFSTTSLVTKMKASK